MLEEKSEHVRSKMLMIVLTFWFAWVLSDVWEGRQLRLIQGLRALGWSGRSLAPPAALCRLQHLEVAGTVRCTGIWPCLLSAGWCFVCSWPGSWNLSQNRLKQQRIASTCHHAKYSSVTKHFNLSIASFNLLMIYNTNDSGIQNYV